MKRASFLVFILLLFTVCIVTGCQKVSEHTEYSPPADTGIKETSADGINNQIDLNSEFAELDSGFVELSPHLSAVEFSRDDFFEEFLKNGGACDDSDVAAFLIEKLGAKEISFSGNPFGCSTIAVESPEGEQLFGRNFDWNHCDALIVKSSPQNGYASISTVNIDFIQGISFASLPDEAKALIALYVPWTE